MVTVFWSGSDSLPGNCYCCSLSGLRPETSSNAPLPPEFSSGVSNILNRESLCLFSLGQLEMCNRKRSVNIEIL